jgi:hypothetical protein
VLLGLDGRHGLGFKLADVGDGDVSPFASEDECHGPNDPARAAGDDGDPILESQLALTSPVTATVS